MDKEVLLLEKLQKWRVQTDKALERFADDAELYVECLKEFSKDSAFLSLSENLSNEKYSEAFEDAHSLKGVSANLSLDPICELVCVIVEKLRKNNLDKLDCDVAKLKKIKMEYDEIMAEFDCE